MTRVNRQHLSTCRATDWLLADSLLWICPAPESEPPSTLVWGSRVGNTTAREHSEEMWPGRKHRAVPNRKEEGEPVRHRNVTRMHAKAGRAEILGQSRWAHDSVESLPGNDF